MEDFVACLWFYVEETTKDTDGDHFEGKYELL